jgi:hypothetical protein
VRRLRIEDFTKTDVVPAWLTTVCQGLGVVAPELQWPLFDNNQEVSLPADPKCRDGD